jgi:hypothetical protein
MILTHGDVTQLRALPWYTVELRSEKTIETTLRRLGSQIATLFKDEEGRITPVELFIPISYRDLDRFDLTTGNYLFVRSQNFPALLRLKSVTGVVGLLTEGDSNRPSKAIKIEDAHVQPMIAAAEQAHQRRAEGIEVGSFVRLLDGEARDWCGTITAMSNGVACVRVEIKTKFLVIETPVRNLLNLSHVPAELATFYYSPLVDSLAESENVDLIAEDLHYTPDEYPHDDMVTAPKPMRHGRQQTVTALVKRLILTGTTYPLEIAKTIKQALKDGSVRPPKNLSIVHGVIKTLLIKEHFRKIDPTLTNYRDVPLRYGVKYRFSIADIARIDPQVGIPVSTLEVCTDGRSSDRRKQRDSVPIELAA